MGELTHWKKFINPDYIGAYALQPGEEPVFTIKSVGRERVKSQGGREEECTVAHFEEESKPMILNRTNCKTIAAIYGTPYIEEWEGKKIQLYATTAMFQGEEVEALRVRPKAPVQEKPKFDTKHKHWNTAIQRLMDGELSLDELTQRYTIPKDSMEKLKEAANA